MDVGRELLASSRGFAEAKDLLVTLMSTPY